MVMVCSGLAKYLYFCVKLALASRTVRTADRCGNRGDRTHPGMVPSEKGAWPEDGGEDEGMALGCIILHHYDLQIYLRQSSLPFFNPFPTQALQEQ